MGESEGEGEAASVVVAEKNSFESLVLRVAEGSF